MAVVCSGISPEALHNPFMQRLFSPSVRSLLPSAKVPATDDNSDEQDYGQYEHLMKKRRRMEDARPSSVVRSGIGKEIDAYVNEAIKGKVHYVRKQSTSF